MKVDGFARQASHAHAQCRSMGLQIAAGDSWAASWPERANADAACAGESKHSLHAGAGDSLAASLTARTTYREAQAGITDMCAAVFEQTSAGWQPAHLVVLQVKVQVLGLGALHKPDKLLEVQHTLAIAAQHLQRRISMCAMCLVFLLSGCAAATQLRKIQQFLAVAAQHL